MFSRLFNAFGSDESESHIRQVDPVTIRGWWAAGQVVLIDVRERDEHAAERIEGAINNPLSIFNPEAIPEPAEGQHLVIHCRSGVRCGSAAKLLAAAGWEGEIIRMDGGLHAWIAFGGPTVKG